MRFGLIRPAVVVAMAASSLACSGGTRESKYDLKKEERMEDAQVNAFIEGLSRKITGFSPVILELKPGRQVLNKSQGLTIEHLRGVDIDDDPPRGVYVKEGPFVAPGVKPFRFRHFTNEFNWCGHFVQDMNDYAASHGFNVVVNLSENAPPGTRQLRWGHMLSWENYFSERGLTWQRWDQLARRDVLGEIIQHAWEPIPGGLAMADLEHPWPLKLEELRKQPWYPKDAPDQERARFELDYYHGFALTHTAVVEALRKKGWKSVGVYPQPFTLTWWAFYAWIEKEPGTNGLPNVADSEAWRLYGKEISSTQDVLYPDHYKFYWQPNNAVYGLAQADHDIVFARSIGKPLRPYYWPLLHGGDAHHVWWRYQPIPLEDVRASFFFVFFTGCDGVVLWNFSGSNECVPPELKDYDYWTEPAYHPDEGQGTCSLELMVGKEFRLSPESGGAPVTFQRNDVLAVTRIDTRSDQIWFQHIDTSRRDAQDFKRSKDKPTFRTSIRDLLPKLRLRTDTTAAAVEGLALAKLLEPALYKGELKIDRPAIRQFVYSEPIVRRVKFGDLHIIATYDGNSTYRRTAGRQVILDDFDGIRGLTLVLPADKEVRVFVLREKR